MSKQNEQLFFSKLKEVFIGAQIEGESGFINLMRIKSAYFDIVLQELTKEINTKTKDFPDFKEEMYDKLYSFFKTYFSESGSIYFRYTPLKSKVYEMVYSNQRDVALFWKTHMLYYVKTDKLWNNLSIDFPVDWVTYKVHFDVSKMEHKSDNQKREIIYDLKKIQGKEITFEVQYSARGRKTKTDDILREFRKKDVFIDEEKLDEVFKIFEKQNEVDYFINKDAKSFLMEQFDLWLKNYLFDDESDFSERRLRELKTLKDIAFKVIDFISQFEDELVKIWNKPKFVLNSNYIITLDRIAAKNDGMDVIDSIIKHKGFEEQKKEWEELGILKSFDKNKLYRRTIDNGKQLSDEYQHLPIDTKHFDGDLKLEVLSLFENLDEELEGWLIHSENYQALKTLLPKYKNKLKAIYIDPPYNSPSTEIWYVNNYRHASWLTLMSDRLSLGKELLNDNGVLICAIDENEQERLGLLFEELFPDYDRTCVTVIHNPGGVQGQNFSYNHEYSYFVYPRNGTYIGLEERSENPDIRPLRDVSTGSHLRKDAKKCFYPILVKGEELIGFGGVCEDDFHPESANVQREDGVIEVYPIDAQGNERKWVFARQSVETIEDELFVEYNKRRGIYDIIRTKTRFNYKTVWSDKRYNSNSYGSKLLGDLMGRSDNFSFPKSVHIIEESLYATTQNDCDCIIMDFFAGSGTAAHSVKLLNRKTGGKRKFILVEMAEYFQDVVLPRVKKVAYSYDWKHGKAKSHDGDGLFCKYYELEQYEHVLHKAIYKKTHPFFAFDDESIYQQYVFMKDQKLLEAVEMDYETNKVSIDLTAIYPNADIAETLSNLTGKRIKKIEKNAVLFEDGERMEYDNLDFRLIRPLIWW